MLLEVSANAAEQDRLLLTGPLTLGDEREVERDEPRVMPERSEPARQGVISKAGTAVKRARARAQEQDLHATPPLVAASGSSVSAPIAAMSFA